MDSFDFNRSVSLNNIPRKKVIEQLDLIDNSDLSLQEKAYKKIAINRYAETNIPLEYWNLKMEKDFYGDNNLLQKYNDYVQNLNKSYTAGRSFCLAGSHGVGKTSTISCILKKVVEKGYSGLYTTLSDVVSSLIYNVNNEEKHTVRKELIMVNFLAIDEFDSRFIGSENAADLYARSLETIFRTRSQNKQPTLMCTNSPNILEAFNGSLKASLNSLFKGKLEMIPVLGQDFRNKENWRENFINLFKKHQLHLDSIMVNNFSFNEILQTVNQTIVTTEMKINELKINNEINSNQYIKNQNLLKELQGFIAKYGKK